MKKLSLKKLSLKVEKISAIQEIKGGGIINNSIKGKLTTRITPCGMTEC